MADVVNYYLERMLPELEDLEERGLFMRSEIKEIVRRRREFEYRIKRKSKVKEDFLRYIEYEKQLEALRIIRKKVIVQSLKANGEAWTVSASDKSSVSRITSLFHRAVTRFKGDLALWLQYLEYCKAKCKRRVQQVVAKALQLHPHVPGLWIYAASWDFQHNQNVSAARALMQRGLRTCPHSEKLWLQYFRMELSYALKLKARKIVLGIEAGTSTSMDAESELSIKLAKVVFRNAVAAVPNSLAFRQRFIEVLDGFDMGSSSIAEYICNSIATDFTTDEHSWNWRARRCLQHGETKQAQQVFEEALVAVPSALMYELYASFLEERLSSTSQPDDAEQLYASLHQVYERAEQHCASFNIVEGRIRLLSRQGYVDRAKEVASGFCKGVLSDCSGLWMLRLSLEIEIGAQDDHIFKLLKQAVKRLNISKAQDLWLLAMEHFSGRESEFESVLQLLEINLGGNGGGEGGASIAISAVERTLLLHGVKKARRLYKRFLALPGPGLQLFLHCIDLEARLTSMGDPEALGYMRNLFDAALESQGTHNTGLWLHYCEQERRVGIADAATKIYCRAKKTLLEPSLFVQKHQLLLS